LADPAHSRRLFVLLAGLLLAGAAFLRFAQIDRRLLHADEAVQAYQTWQLLRGEGYNYDPADKHGPLLYYAAAGLAKISGQTPATLTVAKFRTVTLLAGLGTLGLLLCAAPRLGRTATLIGATLLAIAPLAVIYDTYFVQEAWFSFFTWALFFATLRFIDRPTLTAALIVGVIAGLMQATKETSVLHFAALGLTLFIVRPWRDIVRLGPQLLTALLAASLVYVIFYSAFFTHPAGLADGLRAYFNYAERASGGPHDQPWFYYISLLWPHTQGGIHWGEPLLLLGALGGAALAFLARANPTHRALAAFTATLLLVYSLIPYKTPWLLLTPYAGLALLAGLGAVHCAHWLPKKIERLAPIIAGLALVLSCAWRAGPALGRYANDSRNPYLYQPTSPDLARLVTTLETQALDKKIAVISPDHAWPLPWYLRERAAVGYFTTPPLNLSAYDIVLLDSRLDLPPPAAASAFGLRPNILLWSAPR
jgi:uncharacterized protein (TIGR03663 family)